VPKLIGHAAAGSRGSVIPYTWAAPRAGRRQAMSIALLVVLCVDLIVVVTFAALVLGRKR
jgi:hypothetical protein